jgi:hypothetical protein
LTGKKIKDMVDNSVSEPTIREQLLLLSCTLYAAFGFVVKNVKLEIFGALETRTVIIDSRDIQPLIAVSEPTLRNQFFSAPILKSNFSESTNVSALIFYEDLT